MARSRRLRARLRSPNSKNGPTRNSRPPDETQHSNPREKPNEINHSFAFAALAITLFAASARADDVKAGDLVIKQVWSRATPGGAKIAGGYLTIETKGAARDRLVSGSADFAGKVEIHE